MADSDFNINVRLNDNASQPAARIDNELGTVRKTATQLDQALDKLGKTTADLDKITSRFEKTADATADALKDLGLQGFKTLEQRSEAAAKALREIEAGFKAGKVSAGLYEEAVKRASKELRAVDQQKFNPLSSIDVERLRQVQGLASDVGRSLAKITLAATAVAGAVTASAIAQESAFTGVTKTVEGTAAELEGLRQELLGLSDRIPVRFNDLAGIAEIAGQLGVERQNVAAFTETIARLASATNIVGEEGALQLAKFINTTDATQESVGLLGSQLVALGNNAATTERDILAMATRVGLTATEAGLGAAAVLEFSTALSSAGKTAELGGTNLAKFFSQINTAVIQGGDELEQYAALAETTGDKFKAAFNEDAKGAILDVLGGLRRLSKENRDVITVMDDLNIKGVEQQGVMLALVSQLDNLRGKYGDLTEAAKETDFLVEESNKRYATAKSRLVDVASAAENLSAAFGRSFLTSISDTLPPLAELLKYLRGVVEESPSASLAIAGLGTVALGSVAGLTAVAFSVETITGAVINLKTALDLLAGTQALKFLTGLKTAILGISVAAASLAALVGGAAYLGLSAIVDSADEVEDAQQRIVDGFNQMETAAISAHGGVESSLTSVADFYREAGAEAHLTSSAFDTFTASALGSAKSAEELAAEVEEVQDTISTVGKDLTELTRLLRDGKITQEAFDAAVDRLNKNLKDQAALAKAAAEAQKRYSEALQTLGLQGFKTFKERSQDVLDALDLIEKEFVAGRVAPELWAEALKNAAKELEQIGLEEVAPDLAKKAEAALAVTARTLDNLVLQSQAANAELLRQANEAASTIGLIPAALSPAVDKWHEYTKGIDLTLEESKEIDPLFKEVSTAITDLGRDMADLIFEGGKITDVFEGLAKTLTRILAQNLFGRLIADIGNLLGATKGLGGLGRIFNPTGAGGIFTGGSAAGAGGVGAGAFFGGALSVGASIGGAVGAGYLVNRALPNDGGPGDRVGNILTGAGAALPAGVLAAGLAGGAGIGGSFGLLAASLSNPISAAVVAALIGGGFVVNRLSNGPITKFGKEFERDFGGVEISRDFTKGLLEGLGISKQQLEPIRKDIASSPLALTGGLEFARAQGKEEDFLGSLENVGNIYGNADFRKPLEFALATNDFTALNAAFVELFKNSTELTRLFGDELQPLLVDMAEYGVTPLTERIKEMEDSGATMEETFTALRAIIQQQIDVSAELGLELDPIIEKYRDMSESAGDLTDQQLALFFALEQVRGAPDALAKELESLDEAIAFLVESGATGEEVLQILGPALLNAAAAAEQLGVELPESVQGMLDLAAAMAEAAPLAERMGDAFENGLGRAKATLEDTSLAAAELSGVFTGLVNNLTEQGQTFDEALAQVAGFGSTGVGGIDGAGKTGKVNVIVGQLVGAFEDLTALGAEIPPQLTQVLDALVEIGAVQIDDQGLYYLAEAAEEAEDAIESFADAAASAFDKFQERAVGRAVDSAALFQGLVDNLVANGTESEEALRRIASVMGDDLVKAFNDLQEVGLDVPEPLQMILDLLLEMQVIEIDDSGFIKLKEAAEDAADAIRDTGDAAADAAAQTGGATFASFSVADRQRIIDLANEQGILGEIYGPGAQASQGAGLSQSADISAFLERIGFYDGIPKDATQADAAGAGGKGPLEAVAEDANEASVEVEALLRNFEQVQAAQQAEAKAASRTLLGEVTEDANEANVEVEALLRNFEGVQAAEAKAASRAFLDEITDAANQAAGSVGALLRGFEQLQAAGAIDVDGGLSGVQGATVAPLDAQVPQLARGGLITGEGLAYLHTGERVIPANSSDNRMNVTISPTIVMQGGGSQQDMERAFEQMLRQSGDTIVNRTLAPRLRSMQRRNSGGGLV